MDATKLLPEKLFCSKCSYPVISLGNQASVACPRCNTWLDLDPKCPGSCLSCHKLQEKNPTACVTEAELGTKTVDAKGWFSETFRKFLGK